MPRCPKVKITFLSLILALNLTSAAWGLDLDGADILAPLLFPSSADWLDASKLSRLPEEDMTRLAPHLQQGLKEWLGEKTAGPGECSVSTDIFESQGRFFQVDVNADGLDDIIYSGHHPCAEGGLTIAWYADGQGGYSIKSGVFDYSYLLRLKPGRDGPLKVTYKPGCCGDFIHKYYQDDWGQPVKYGSRIFRTNGYDDGLNRPLLNKRIALTGEWTEMREYPQIDDEYDSDRSYGLGYVFMGNVLTIVSSYDRQNLCRGTLLNYDQSGEWGLVVLDDACAGRQEFTVSRGDFIKLGWVQAEKFALEPERDPN